MGQRLPRAVLIVTTLLASWLGMQAVHEIGHVVGAVVSGGKVQRVVLHPLTISRTDLSHNPHPLLTVWFGPACGCLIPIGLWGLSRRRSVEFLLKFFAGFCLLANGLYIGVGSFDRVGDCGDMLKQGSPIWTLWLFGFLTVPTGLWLWHGLGPNFGLGTDSREIEQSLVVVCVVAASILILTGLIVGGR